MQGKSCYGRPSLGNVAVRHAPEGDRLSYKKPRISANENSSALSG